MVSKTWRKAVMYSRNTLKSFGQKSLPQRMLGLTQIRCVDLPVQVKVPVDEGIQTKMDAAKAWLGSRYLLHYSNRMSRR